MSAAYLGGWPAASPSLAKTLATYQARAALCGVRVDRLAGDDGSIELVVTAGVRTSRCGSLEELRLVLAELGVAT